MAPKTLRVHLRHRELFIWLAMTRHMPIGLTTRPEVNPGFQSPLDKTLDIPQAMHVPGTLKARPLLWVHRSRPAAGAKITPPSRPSATGALPGTDSGWDTLTCSRCSSTRVRRQRSWDRMDSRSSAGELPSAGPDLTKGSSLAAGPPL